MPGPPAFPGSNGIPDQYELTTVGNAYHDPRKDDENFPGNASTHKGDGIVLFDEYRGFMTVNRNVPEVALHVRTDGILDRDLFHDNTLGLGDEISDIFIPRMSVPPAPHRFM